MFNVNTPLSKQEIPLSTTMDSVFVIKLKVVCCHSYCYLGLVKGISMIKFISEKYHFQYLRELWSSIAVIAATMGEKG